jgi:uncharacterized protein (DUF3084 family)
MVPMTSVEVLQDLLKFAKDLIPLLSEKKLDTAIAGLAEARKTVDSHKAIQADILAAEQKLAKADALEKSLAEREAELQAKINAVNELSVNNNARAKALDGQSKELDSRDAKLAKIVAQNESKALELNALLAKAETDAKETEAAKVAVQNKLAKLSEV